MNRNRLHTNTIFGFVSLLMVTLMGISFLFNSNLEYKNLTLFIFLFNVFSAVVNFIVAGLQEKRR